MILRFLKTDNCKIFTRHRKFCDVCWKSEAIPSDCNICLLHGIVPPLPYLNILIFVCVVFFFFAFNGSRANSAKYAVIAVACCSWSWCKYFLSYQLNRELRKPSSVLFLCWCTSSHAEIECSQLHLTTISQELCNVKALPVRKVGGASQFDPIFQVFPIFQWMLEHLGYAIVSFKTCFPIISKLLLLLFGWYHSSWIVPKGVVRHIYDIRTVSRFLIKTGQK